MRSKTGSPSAISPRRAAGHPSSICLLPVLLVARAVKQVPPVEQTQGFAKHFFDGLIAPGNHLGGDELFKIGGEFDSHHDLSSEDIDPGSGDVNFGEC